MRITCGSTRCCPRKRRRARGTVARLAQARIVSDVRADRIRFGFGCYHTEAEIAAAAAVVARTLA